MRLLVLALSPLLAHASVTVVTESEASVMISDFDVIVDVRSESDYRASHVQNSVHLGSTNLNGCEQQRVAFYCSAGSASEAAANRFSESDGGRQAYAIGTLDNLAANGVPVESGMPSQETGCPSPPLSIFHVICFALLGALALAVLVSIVKALCCSGAKQTKGTATTTTEMQAAEKKLPA